MILDTPQFAPPIARLKVVAPDGEVTHREIVCGEMLLVGSGSSCGLMLPDNAAAGMHCTLSFAGGKIRVRDWNTAQGTCVDGAKIEDEVVAPPGSQIQIGAYRLEVLGTEAEADAAAIQALDKVDLLLGEAVADETDEVESDELESANDAAVELEQPPIEVSVNATALQPVEPQPTVEPRQERAPAAYDHAEFDDDTLELLKAEVELLQNELAERDARLAELEALADLDGEFFDSDSSVKEDSPEVAGLVERLEQLLDELERCDERMSTMADLLRAADDAREAEREERRQIESWIGEIERRLNEREAERQAEQQALRKTVSDLTTQLQRAEQQLDRAAAGGDAAADRDNYLAQMRGEYAALEEKLRRTEEETADLRERLEQADVEAAEARTEAAVAEALREERLKIAQEQTAISQERAGLARERAEFNRLRDQFTQEQQHADGQADGADQRIRAFREHLREIHQTEGRPEPQQGLSARIGKLWRRLEGRPLDTD